MTEQQFKRCPRCDGVKPLDAFGADRSRPPLFVQGRCRPCTNAVTTAARFRRVGRVLNFSEVVAAISFELDALPGCMNGVLEIALSDRRRNPQLYEAAPGEGDSNWRALICGASTLCRQKYGRIDA